MKNMRLESDKRLKKVIQSIHVKYKEYGYPRMKIALQEEGYFIKGSRQPNDIKPTIRHFLEDEKPIFPR